MTDPAQQHRHQARAALRVAVLTISDTRTLATDLGGATIVAYLEQAAWQVAEQRVVPDQAEAIRSAVVACCGLPGIDAVLLTGGTGVTARDVTCDALRPLLTRELPGYGELFRWLSFQQVGPAAMLSRAMGGLVDRVVVLAMPGSPKAVDLAMAQLIVPELAHLVDQARR